ncbi:MAG: aminoglycoside phosphotransferase family protein [Candidatus Heimdallarchaeota archaeon]|nr:aminoglycoside phosphotransferase family protein [Candidatus Heimdallarchaeota archaeon]
MKELMMIGDITGCTEIEPLHQRTSTTMYSAKLKGKKVLIRRFHERNYYGNRFQRENLILKHLDSIECSNLIFPKIIEEYPGHDLHILSWIEGETLDELELPKTDKNAIIHEIWKKISSLEIPSNMKFNHFRDIRMLTEDETRIMNISKSVFLSLKERVWKTFNKSIIKKHPRSIIHGDLHEGNIIVIDKDEGKYAVIDWEFASVGSKYFDLAYYYTFLGLPYPQEYLDEVLPWENTIKLLISHWYLSNFDNYPKEAKYWLDKIRRDLSKPNDLSN